MRNPIFVKERSDQTHEGPFGGCLQQDRGGNIAEYLLNNRLQMKTSGATRKALQATRVSGLLPGKS